MRFATLTSGHIKRKPQAKRGWLATVNLEPDVANEPMRAKENIAANDTTNQDLLKLELLAGLDQDNVVAWVAAQEAFVGLVDVVLVVEHTILQKEHSLVLDTN